MDQPRKLTVSQVSRRLGVNENSVRKNKYLRPTLDDSGARLYDEGEVEAVALIVEARRDGRIDADSPLAKRIAELKAAIVAKGGS